MFKKYFKIGVLVLNLKLFLFLGLLIFSSINCTKNTTDEPFDKNLTIFFINDIHGQLDNFAKVKHVIDKEEGNILFVCSGDIFSGNPVVDNYPKKGYPIIDLMNKTGMNISVLGNHEFDYGEDVLKDRLIQSDFEWVCANIDFSNTNIPQPLEYKTIKIGGLNITFLGLLETNGKENGTIPSTHPLKVKNIIFEKPESVVDKYSDIKEKENSDLYVALTHLGHVNYNGGFSDFILAHQFPYFDFIIGGHSHQKLDTVVNDIPIFQSGSYLNNLGKIELLVKDRKVKNIKFELIDLNNYPESDQEIADVIEIFNSNAASILDEVIGYSNYDHDKDKVGCFYTDALRHKLNVDITFQNSGGIRSKLNEGDITKREIFEIDPFNNGTVIYSMTIGEIKEFLEASNSEFYYSGVDINQTGNTIQINDSAGNILEDNIIVSVGINDYIPAVYDGYFPVDREIQPFTTAEAIIDYLQNINSEVSYFSCDRSFRFQ